MTDPVLTVEDVTVTYPGVRRRGRRQPIQAVRDVSFEVVAGETFGLVGESGAGKSTVGRAVLGLIRPTAGHITIDGRDIHRVGRRDERSLRAAAQAVFQDPTSSLNPARPISDTIGETLRLHHGLRGDAALRAATAVCEQVSLSADLLFRLPAELSGGQRQRAAIARALAPHPRLIVCDEPITALDVSTQAQVINLLADLRDQTGVALLFISHDLAVIRHIAQRVAVMFDGHLVEVGPTAAVCDQPAHPYTDALLAAVPVADPTRQRARRRQRQSHEAGAISREASGHDLGCPYAFRCPRVTDVCRDTVPPLALIPDRWQVACHHPTIGPGGVTTDEPGGTP